MKTLKINGAIIPTDHKWIYNLFDMESTCPADVEEFLTESGGKDVLITINSGGGDVFAGSEIYESLRNYCGKVTIKVVGIAASAASVIACAGYSEIAPTAMLMIHNVSGHASGDYRKMDKSSEVLQQANKAIAAAYAQKSGKSVDEFLKSMNSEKWYTAQEAVDMGLIDNISVSQNTNNIQLVASLGSGMIPPQVIAKYQSERLQAKLQAQLDLLNLNIF